MRTARKAKHRIPPECTKAILGGLNWRANFYTGLQKRRHGISSSKENKTKLSASVDLNLLGIAIFVDRICTDLWTLNLTTSSTLPEPGVIFLV